MLKYYRIISPRDDVVYLRLLSIMYFDDLANMIRKHVYRIYKISGIISYIHIISSHNVDDNYSDRSDNYLDIANDDP